MNSKIKKSVIPFGAIITVATILIVTIFSDLISSTTLANDNLNQALRSYKEFVNDQNSNTRLRRP